jgi:hypothetical protein
MIVIILFSLLLIALFIIHMMRPRFKTREISAARFFRNLPPPKNQNQRLNIGNPLKSLPLYIQIPILLLLITAVLIGQQLLQGPYSSRLIGIWMFIDTSASMSTKDSGHTRIQAAQDAALRILPSIKSIADSAKIPFCIRISGFDLERTDLIPASGDLGAIQGELAKISSRPLGTDLSILQKIVDDPSAAINGDETTGDVCPITHMVVISDLPAPQWVSHQGKVDVIWQDIASQVENSGITTVHALRDPITAKVYQIRVELKRYGDSQDRIMHITDPQGKLVKEEAVTWGSDDLWQGTFEPQGSGLYRIQIFPEDAYRYDDDVSIDVSTGSELRVDWQLPDRTLLSFLPWQEDSKNPDFRVVAAFSDLNGDSPELLVGSGYKKIKQTEEIRYFLEGHPLLDDLNFDVAVDVGNAGQTVPDGFEPILAGANSIWAAYRKSPPAVYVPGVPQGEGNTNAFSTTLFFNAVRWLLQAGPQQPLYTLTSPQQPSPAGSRTVLHEDEGNTAYVPASMGSIDELRPAFAPSETQPAWPICIFVAMILFLIERFLFSKGGDRWR